MITLFVLGAVIGAGACLLVDITATNDKLNKQIKEMEEKEKEKNENVCSS